MEQCFIQVRVDEKLKADAIEVLDRIGLDMPVAIRMFLKRIVLEQGLPFDAKIPTDIATELPYKPNVVTVPAIPAKYVDYSEFEDALRLVPKGMLTRHEDVLAYLAKKHNAARVELTGIHSPIDILNKTCPYWREVTTRGLLWEGRFTHTKEQQEVMLKEEGHTIIPSGPQGKMPKVKDYKSYLFNFDSVL